MRLRNGDKLLLKPDDPDLLFEFLIEGDQVINEPEPEQQQQIEEEPETAMNDGGASDADNQDMEDAALMDLDMTQFEDEDAVVIPMGEADGMSDESEDIEVDDVEKSKSSIEDDPDYRRAMLRIQPLLDERRSREKAERKRQRQREQAEAKRLAEEAGEQTADEPEEGPVVKRAKRKPAAEKKKTPRQAFMDEERPRLEQEHPDWTKAKITRHLGDLWKRKQAEEEEESE